ncbi:hypothetical protein J3T65_09810 [Staphylococcus simiae]|uniref:DNA polymerase n=1 Tax=Staphylococcus simiae TaxID=308354 RepID=UPI001A9869EE|nr:DNA polymerase [Staphylococcus simiae]MBO1198279.1 hypothetical protein [Staphylococcus simiae]MBO1201986.1 hypothetical protein [Staphylococcus simiae]MBO1204182.1 hypothetical protein [Staphylococcus simiae]MBO1210271.1 hypothetical protein [Staphylococcus simiae]MBO1230416.1 hypothetical protein [Staphylococcus simiae]
MEIKSKLISLPEADKTTSWLTDKASEQLEVSLLKDKIAKKVNHQYDQLTKESKSLLDNYINVHYRLEPLMEYIESNGIVLDIEQIPDIKENILQKAKREEHRARLIQYFDSLEQKLNDTKRLHTHLSLIGTRTHRITSKQFNIQGLPKAIQQIIVPSQFNKVFTIDFKAFEPSVVAYMTQDQQLIKYLNHEEGLYDLLLKELSIDKDKRKYVKRAFIGSFLFGGNFNSPKFKLNQYVSEVQWIDAVSQFTEVIKLKKSVDANKSMHMPYGIEHDMSAFQGSSIMAIYVQTVASYIFKNVLLEVYKAQCKQDNFRIIIPIHDAIMIECDGEDIAQSVEQLMINTANKLFNGDFAHTTVEVLGGASNEQ